VGGRLEVAGRFLVAAGRFLVAPLEAAVVEASKQPAMILKKPAKFSKQLEASEVAVALAAEFSFLELSAVALEEC
jgi:hypothetical protein